MHQKAELVFIPMPGVGHLLSTIEVAKLLLTRHENLLATVLIMKLPFDTKVTTYIDTLNASLNASSSSISHRIKFMYLLLENMDPQMTPTTYMGSFIEDQKPQVRNVLTKLTKSYTDSDSPHVLAGLVIDMFCTQMIDVANEFSVPTFVFFTSSVGFLGLVFYLQSLLDEQNLDMTKFKNNPTSELTVPGFLNQVTASVLPGIVLDKEGAPAILYHVKRYIETKGILVNSFLDLEPYAITSMLREDLKLPPLYTVGPILNLNSDDQSLDLIKWLDDQPPSSVVFLCFGSKGSFGDDQVKEIALALESSRVRFVWSLRKPPQKDKGKPPIPSDYEDLSEILPVEFLNRTAGRGKIIGWASQVGILAHPAIGGFVSHCGWNSILESLWFGVPIATWPLYAEQQLNAFQLVRELGLAVEIKLDSRRGFYYDIETEIVSAEEIEIGIRKVMEHDSNIRKKVKEISRKSNEAMMDGGSSYLSLERFINDVVN